MAMSSSITTFPPSLQVSLTSVFREARIVFKAGKNRDGYFGAEELLAQVDSAIDIFEGLSKGRSKALFLFDNAPSHQKRALDAISARKMAKGVPVFAFHFICLTWPGPSTQGRKRAGHTTRVGHACDAVSSRMVTPSHFTSRTTILPCPAGSRGWSRSSRSAVYGRLRGSWRSVTISAAPLDALIAAVGGSFFHSRTSPITSRNSKNLSSPAATFATFTPNITAN